MSNEPRRDRTEGDDGPGRPGPGRQAVGFDEGTTWFDAVENLLDETIDRDEEYVCTFERFEVEVPARMDGDAPRARWRLDGTVTVSIEGTRGPLAEWLEWWSHRVA